MIIKRTIELEADPAVRNGANFEVGDVIGFTLNDGEEVEAMAMKQEEDGFIFALVDCIVDEQPMMRDGKLVMRDYLNKDLYIRFPEEIRNMMLPSEHGDMLRLMTECEVFGGCHYGSDALYQDAQFEPMKDRRNRIANLGMNGEVAWYWLADKIGVASGTAFASVSSGGNSNTSGASDTHGVRPAFKIKNL